jgi:hypothetical protein
VWLLDGATGKVYMFDDRGRKVFQTGPTLAGNGRALKEPSDMVILPDERLMISDSGNNRLLVCRILFEER